MENKNQNIPDTILEPIINEMNGSLYGKHAKGVADLAQFFIDNKFPEHFYHSNTFIRTIGNVNPTNIELAKKFSTENSSKFINGLLDQLKKERKK